MSVRAHIRVPATSANLGPGYDCAGLALELYDDLSAEINDGAALRISVTGEGADTVPTDDSHLVVRSMARGFREAGLDLPEGLQLTCHNRIPHGRGLGSSSAAIVGGLALARELIPDGERILTDRKMLEVATEIEGHPDNVAPAIFGGLTIAWIPTEESSTRAQAVRLIPSSRLQPVVTIPAQPLATEQARELLPASVPHALAAANGARSALLAPALTSHLDLLFTATEDFLHQHFRRFAYPQAYALMVDLRGRGIPAMISGAGPSVIALGVSGTALDGAAVESAMVGAAAASDDVAKAAFVVVAVPVDIAGVSAVPIS